MRRSIAAACLAVLVGLAAPAALARASLGVGGDRPAIGFSLRAHAPGSARAPSAAAAPQPRAEVSSLARCAPPAAIVVWRTPSGPAPSQAPPAA